MVLGELNPLSFQNWFQMEIFNLKQLSMAFC